MNKKVIILNTILILLFLAIIIIDFENLGITGLVFSGFYESETLHVLNAYSNEESIFIIPIKNKEQENITNLYAIIEIFDLNNKKIDKITTHSININSGQEKELRGFWNNTEKAGEYQARVSLFSEELDATFIKRFNLKEKTLYIENVFIDEARLGDIVNIEVLVENNLDKNIEDVVTSVLLYNLTQEKTISLKTETKKVDANSTKTFVLSWDTKDIKPGTYNGHILVESQEHSIDREIVLYIDNYGIRIIGVGFSIRYSPDDNVPIFILTLSFIFILIIINIGWYLVFRKIKNKKIQR